MPDSPPNAQPEGPASSLLLAIDTCGPTGSVALAQVLRAQLQILGESELASRTYSTTLIASVCELLTLAQVQLRSLPPSSPSAAPAALPACASG